MSEFRQKQPLKRRLSQHGRYSPLSSMSVFEYSPEDGAAEPQFPCEPGSGTNQTTAQDYIQGGVVVFDNASTATHLTRGAVVYASVGIPTALHKVDLLPCYGSLSPRARFLWTSEKALTALDQQATRQIGSTGIAFTAVDEVRGRSQAQLLTRVIGYLKSFSKLSYAKELARRIENLSQLFKEDFGSEATLSAKSLSSLLTFLEMNPSVIRPKLSATPSGYLIASWRGSNNQTLAVHFLESGTVRYFGSNTNPRNDEIVDRFEGTSTADSLFYSAALERLGWMR